MSLENALGLSGLRSLYDRSRGSSQIAIGLIDGPVDLSHHAFHHSRIKTARDFQLISVEVLVV